MLRLSTLSREVSWPTTLLLAKVIAGNPSAVKGKGQTKVASKKKIMSSRVTSRSQTSSPASGNESTMKPSASAVCLTSGGNQTPHAHATVTSTPPPQSLHLPSSSSPLQPPPPVPLAHGRSFCLQTLQRRIRSIIVQLVLLSAEPLRPSALFDRYRRVVDQETANMSAWAAHAVYKYDHGLLRCSGMEKNPRVCQNTSREENVGSKGVDPHKVGAAADGDDGASTVGSVTEAEERMLWDQGQQLSRAFRASVVPLVATLCSGGAAEASLVPRLPSSHDVEQWIFLSIIFSDAEFRVSPYSGAVSYPALPSMLLATVDPMRDREVAKLCYALQWGARAKAAAYALFRRAGGEGGSSNYLSSTATCREGQRRSLSLDTARDPAAFGMDEFSWLNGAAGSPPWTTAHGQYLLHSAVTRVRKLSDESDIGTSANRLLREALLSAAELNHSSGHPLVDVMLKASSVADAQPHSRGTSSRAPDLSATSSGATPVTTRGAAAAAAQPPTLGWNEGKKGTDVATSFVTDASEDGLFCVMMGELSKRSLSAGAMCEINRRLISHLFRKLSAIPVSLARLSTVVRWNLSVAYAAHYPSFLYFILLTAANPTVHRMAHGRRHRRRVNAVCADSWGEKKEDIDEADCHLEDEVRNALAQHDPGVFRGLRESSRTQGSALAALRRAFVADANVTKKCDSAAGDVIEVVCVRVLPHRRPGQWLSATVAPGDAKSPPAEGAAFCGYPLNFVEVLPTWRKTPEEIMEYLWRQQDPVHLRSSHRHWLEENEESYILAFSLDRGVLEKRLRLAVERYLDLTGGGSDPAASHNDASTRRVTLHELGLITLWAHEYGAEMAAELLFVLLLPRHDEVRLYPPPPSKEGQQGAAPTQVTATRDSNGERHTPNSGYGSWTVAFVAQ